MVQILPKDDTFAAGTPSFGALVCLYLGCPISTSNINGLWNPTAAAFAATRPMHAAYQTTNSQGILDSNAAFHSTGAATRVVSGAVFRRPFGTDVTVTGTFEMRALAGGAPGVGDLAPRGVIARVSGGSLAGDGTDLPWVQNVDCYMAACYQKSGDSTLRFSVLRWNAGVFTILGAEGVAIPTTTLNMAGLATVTLQVTGTGASVTVVGTLRGFGGSGILTVSRTDTDASRIVVAGRCGFFMGPDRIVSGRTTVDLCHLLAVDEGGVRLLQDEFQRLSLAAAKQTTTDAAGTTGSGYLSSAFYWDAATFDGSFSAGGKTYTGSRRFRRNATANRSDFDHQVTDDDVNAGRMILSQRPADNQFSQHRSVKYIIPTAPAAATGEVWAGVVLRALQAQPLDENPPTIAVSGSRPNFPTNGTAGTGGYGYFFVCRCKTSTTITWELFRLTSAGKQALASLDESSPFSTSGFAYNNLTTIDLDCYPRNAADPFGPVELVCKVNAQLLPMTPSASVQNPSTGVFVDAFAGRIKNNLGEGIVVANGFARTGTTSANIDPVFQDWLQGTLTNATVLDVDQLSIAVAGEPEPTGTSLNSVFDPDYPLEVEYVTHEVSNPFDSGHRQTMPRFVAQATDTVVRRQRFKCKKSGATLAQLNALIAHWNSHDGVGIAFNFTPPGDSTYPVHYVEDSLRYAMVAPGTFEFEVEVEELK